MSGVGQDRPQPPQALEVEQAVLGAILKDPEALNAILEVIRDPYDFYAPKHQMIFQAALDLFADSEPVDITTIVSRLQNKAQLDKVGGRVYLVDLVEQVASTGNVASYAKIILEKSVLRRLIATSSEILNSCYAVEMPAEDLLDRAEGAIFALAEKSVQTGLVPLVSILPESLDYIVKIQRGDWQGGVRTRFGELDKITGGLHDSDLIIIAGRPSMGKTALALNIAEEVANGPEGKAVAVFSIEMSRESISLRMLCEHAKVNLHRMRSAKLSDQEFTLINRASGALSGLTMFIDDSAQLSTLQLHAKARRLKAQHKNLSLIIVDYIQLMHAAGRYENRQQEVTAISRSLKALAKELKVPVIACSQLSRGVETRGGDKRPQLSDLRESGAIEQDADIVMFVYRPEYYLSDDERKDPKHAAKLGYAEIIVAKHRNGPLGTAKLAFINDFARFRNLESYRYPVPPAQDNLPF